MTTDKAKQSCDIFSLGVALWKMINGIHSKPFDRAVNTDVNYYLIYKEWFDIFWNEKHSGCRLVKLAKKKEQKNIDVENATEIENGIHLKHLFEKVFTFDPHLRITIDEILNDEWYKNTKSYNNDKYKNIFYNKMSEIHVKVKQKYSHLQSQKQETEKLEKKRTYGMSNMMFCVF